jgi:hypothetical protein
VASNCIDRHLAKRAEQVAIIWEGDDPNEIAENEVDALGDISTLADPAVVSDLIKNRQPPKVSSK